MRWKGMLPWLVTFAHSSIGRWRALTRDGDAEARRVMLSHPDIDALTERAYEPLRRTIDLVIDAPNEVSIDWLRRRGYLAVPFETAQHFDDELAQGLARAIRGTGVEWIAAIVVDPLSQPDTAFRLEPSPEAFFHLDDGYGSYCVLLLPPGEEFAVLLTDEVAGIAAGKAAFVEEFLGVTVAEARERFDRYGEMPLSPRMTEYYRRMSARYRDIGG